MKREHKQEIIQSEKDTTPPPRCEECLTVQSPNDEQESFHVNRLKILFTHLADRITDKTSICYHCCRKYDTEEIQHVLEHLLKVPPVIWKAFKITPDFDNAGISVNISIIKDFDTYHFEFELNCEICVGYDLGRVECKFISSNESELELRCSEKGKTPTIYVNILN